MRSSLRAAAAEFQPSTQNEQKQQPQQHQHGASPAEPLAAAADEQQQQEEQWENCEESAWNELGLETVDQAVQLLHSWFSSHTEPMLRELYVTCGCSLDEALGILCSLEAEQLEQERQEQEEERRRRQRLQQQEEERRRREQQLQEQRRRQELQLGSDELFPSLAAAAAAAPSGRRRKDGATAGGGAAAATAAASANWAAVASRAATPTAAGAAASCSSAAAAAAAAPDRGARRPPALAGGAQGGLTDDKVGGGVPWVQTGAAVAREYADARAEASDYARVRNACFQQATVAYLAGDKALAKELSMQGKEAAARMFECHQRASSQIFGARNAGLSTAGAVVDLHGLHVSEALQLLPEQLTALASRHRAASVIVGVGKHTKGPPSARVGPAVEALLRELGYSYSQPQPGLLRVQLG